MRKRRWHRRIATSPTGRKCGEKRVKQQKTGTELLIPIHPTLAGIIAGSRRLPDGVTDIRPQPFLTKERGGAYGSRTAFGNQFRVWCHQAGLPAACSAHGLRKAACRRLAEAGCSAMQIAAISGHKTLAEVERYVKAANQAKLAEAAMKAVL